MLCSMTSLCVYTMISKSRGAAQISNVNHFKIFPYVFSFLRLVPEIKSNLKYFKKTAFQRRNKLRRNFSVFLSEKVINFPSKVLSGTGASISKSISKYHHRCLCCCLLVCNSKLPKPPLIPVDIFARRIYHNYPKT